MSRRPQQLNADHTTDAIVHPNTQLGWTIASAVWLALSRFGLFLIPFKAYAKRLDGRKGA